MNKLVNWVQAAERYGVIKLLQARFTDSSLRSDRKRGGDLFSRLGRPEQLGRAWEHEPIDDLQGYELERGDGARSAVRRCRSCRERGNLRPPRYGDSAAGADGRGRHREGNWL